MNNQLTRTDTTALVGSVLMGIVFVIACQASGFIDNMLPTGKMGMYLINGSIWATFTALIVLLYKQPAGLIAGEVQALFSILFSPLWIAFVFANAVGSLAVTAVTSKCSMEKWSHYALALFLCNALGNAVVGVGLILVFHLPTNVAVVQSIITILVCWPVSTVLTKMIHDGIKKSGLVR